MIYKIKATNKHNGEIIEFDLEGNAVEGFCYFDEELKEATHLLKSISSKTLTPENVLLIRLISKKYSLGIGFSMKPLFHVLFAV